MSRFTFYDSLVKQEDSMSRSLLMIPGPVEVDGDVLAAMGRPPVSHVSPGFVQVFGECLDGLRDVFAAPDGQPFVVAGSGTLAMEIAVANITEPGDRAVVVDTGYFSARMADILRRHGAQVESVGAELGHAPDLAAVQAALARGAKILTITQVDTSTGVLTPVRELAVLGRQHDALVIVDGVCATGGQEFRQTEWDVDVCLTASQKALAVPPGLALVMARPRALEAFKSRQTPVASYYADWGLWQPVMQAYQARKPAYFGTPAVNLVAALNESVRQIKAEGMEARWARHHKLAAAFKAGIAALGIREVPVSPAVRADTLTVMYYPDGIDSTLLGRIGATGVVVAGGLYPSIASKSFRVGHMGVDTLGDLLRTIAAIEQGLGVKSGAGVAAAQASWTQ
jgi:alanine-glyoxylate transaminase/serine-glyoxylate transaminase/serine-pyruvate transaminase